MPGDKVGEGAPAPIEGVTLTLWHSGKLVSKVPRPTARALLRKTVEDQRDDFSCSRHGLSLGIRVSTLKDDDDDDVILWWIYACCETLAEKVRLIIDDVQEQVKGT